MNVQPLEVRNSLTQVSILPFQCIHPAFQCCNLVPLCVQSIQQPVVHNLRVPNLLLQFFVLSFVHTHLLLGGNKLLRSASTSVQRSVYVRRSILSAFGLNLKRTARPSSYTALLVRSGQATQSFLTWGSGEPMQHTISWHTSRSLPKSFDSSAAAFSLHALALVPCILKVLKFPVARSQHRHCAK